MAGEEKKYRNNKFNIEWIYAKQFWDCLKAGIDVPPVPTYTLWETNDKREGE